MYESELAEGERCGDFLLETGDLQVSERRRVVEVWPVLVALDAAALDVGGEHDDERAVLLPHHLPEVERRVGQRALRRDVAVHDARAGNLHLNIKAMTSHCTRKHGATERTMTAE